MDSELDLFPYASNALQQQLVSYYQSGPGNQGTLQPPQKYDLYAISNHFGTMGGGHYTATVRNPARKAWFHYDDSRVSEICAMNDVASENARVKTKAAYSLFYVSWDLTSYRSE
jgi:ubiquitin C-terminal hydrolase